MNIRIPILSLLLCIMAVTTVKAMNDDFSHLEAGTVIAENVVRKHSLNDFFYAKDISQTVFNRMHGKSYKNNCTVKRSDLRYVRVLHYNAQGEIKIGELVCHREIAADLVDIFKKLFKVRYPIERMVLIDNYGADDERAMEANNSSCFNFRFVGGTKVPSNHSWGKAIDINPLYNPYVKKFRNGKTIVSPAKGKEYADRTKNFKYKINKTDPCYKEFIRHGFVWGGNWKSVKDYQHFEKK